MFQWKRVDFSNLENYPFQLSSTLEAVNDEHDQLDFEAEEPDKME